MRAREMFANLGIKGEWYRGYSLVKWNRKWHIHNLWNHAAHRAFDSREEARQFVVQCEIENCIRSLAVDHGLEARQHDNGRWFIVDESGSLISPMGMDFQEAWEWVKAYSDQYCEGCHAAERNGDKGLDYCDSSGFFITKEITS